MMAATHSGFIETQLIGEFQRLLETEIAWVSACIELCQIRSLPRLR